MKWGVVSRAIVRASVAACACAGLAACDGMPPEEADTDEAGAAVAETPAEAEPAAVVDQDVAQALALNGHADVLVVLDTPPVDDVRAALLSALYDDVKTDLVRRIGNAERLTRYRHLPIEHLRVRDAAALVALAEHPGVRRVSLDTRYEATGAANLDLIGQPAAAAKGNLGAGTAVAVIDTGVDYKRAAFGSCTSPGAPSSCRVPFAMDFATEDDALDDVGHGTNVGAIVAAVAPGAKVLSLDVFSGQYASASTILAAVNWVVENRATYKIAAMNLSLGSGSYAAACGNDVFAAALATARAAGVIPVVSSGNDAKATAIASPACVPAAVSVGAVYAAAGGGLRTPACSDAAAAVDKVACFSSSAPILTLLAPGVFINAADITMTGTSQAAPHVAGAFAVLRGAFPSETVDQLIKRVTSTGKVVTDARNKVATPRLALAAALAAPSPPIPQPAPRGSFTINAGASVAVKAAVSLAFTITSGTPTHVCISNTSTCTSWTPAAATKTWSLSAGDGFKTVSVWWKNVSGAVTAEPARASITLDATAPTGGTFSAVLGTGLTAALAWPGIEDRGSGVASYRVVAGTTAPPAKCVGGTLVYAGSNTSAAARLLVSKGKTFYRVCATDKVGNVSAGLTTQIAAPPAVR